MKKYIKLLDKKIYKYKNDWHYNINIDNYWNSNKKYDYDYDYHINIDKIFEDIDYLSSDIFQKTKFFTENLKDNLDNIFEKFNINFFNERKKTFIWKDLVNDSYFNSLDYRKKLFKNHINSSISYYFYNFINNFKEYEFTTEKPNLQQYFNILHSKEKNYLLNKFNLTKIFYFLDFRQINQEKIDILLKHSKIFDLNNVINTLFTDFIEINKLYKEKENHLPFIFSLLIFYNEINENINYKKQIISLKKENLEELISFKNSFINKIENIFTDNKLELDNKTREYFFELLSNIKANKELLVLAQNDTNENILKLINNSKKNILKEQINQYNNKISNSISSIKTDIKAKNIISLSKEEKNTLNQMVENIKETVKLLDFQLLEESKINDINHLMEKKLPEILNLFNKINFKKNEEKIEYLKIINNSLTNILQDFEEIINEQQEFLKTQLKINAKTIKMKK